MSGNGVETWRETVERARADGMLVTLARAIARTNREGCRNRTKYLAFADRCEELGLRFPSAAYRSVLLSVLAAE